MTCPALWEEYQLIYGIYEGFNSQSLTIKGWSATVGLAAIIAVYSHRSGISGHVAVAISALSSLPFWIMDAFWKSYQKSYEARIQYLEGIEDCAKGYDPFQIWRAWDASHNAFDWVFLMYMPNVALPHAFVLFLGIYLAVWHPPRDA